jgi:sugar lactone lactonase YvrE
MIALAGILILAGCGKVGERPIEEAAAASAYVSPENLAVAPDGRMVYAACATAQRIMAVSPDGATSRVWSVATTQTAKPVPVNPTGIAVAPDGDIWVTCGVQGGELQRHGADAGIVQHDIIVFVRFLRAHARRHRDQ